MENWNPLSKIVATRIEDLMSSSEDRRLPSQRELSTLFGVGRTSVREALSLLQASGKLRTEPGRGSFWVDRPGDNERPSESLALTESRLGLSRHTTYPISEIARLRYLIEGQAGRLAAMRVEDAEVQQLELNLARFKTQIRAKDLRASAETDFEFHQMIAQFSRVELFSDLHLFFKDVIMQAVQMTNSHYARAWEPVAEHEKIVEAMRRRDPDEVLYYAQSHIVRSAERLGIVNSNEIL